MQSFLRLEINPRIVSGLLIFASAAMLAGALFFQEIMKLPPCVLCEYQRVPYIVVIGLATAAFLLEKKIFRLWLLSFCALALFINAGIAGFHVGVENGWWKGTDECGGNFGSGELTLEQLRDLILAAPVVRCDEVAWSLFGISMAGYNMMIALAMGIFTLMSVLYLACPGRAAQKSLAAAGGAARQKPEQEKAEKDKPTRKKSAARKTVTKKSTVKAKKKTAKPKLRRSKKPKKDKDKE
ncbi:MAG: disulfide bond formation protein B [Micavibrio sp.]|nr:MAG: disulfide bond formation protein B [Micavibrio sp.]